MYVDCDAVLRSIFLSAEYCSAYPFGYQFGVFQYSQMTVFILNSVGVPHNLFGQLCS